MAMQTLEPARTESENSDIWQSLLPLDVEAVLHNAHGGPLRYDSLKDLVGILYSQVLLGDGTEGYWKDRNSGGVFRSYSARTLQIDPGKLGDSSSWSWVSKQGSRFAEVAYLDHSPWLEVNGNIQTKLPPGTYTLTWVLQFDPDRSSGWEEEGRQPVLFYFADGLRNIRADSLYFPFSPNQCSRVRDGNWLEYDHHTFIVEEDPNATENLPEVNIKFSLTETSSPLVKSGLYLDGVVIRPVQVTPENGDGTKIGEERDLHEQQEETEQDLDEEWKDLLPSGYETIVKIAKGGPLQYESYKSLHDRLCEPVLLGEGFRVYWIDRRTNRVCRSYSARYLTITWSDNLNYWNWIKKAGSRFEDIAHLKEVCWFEAKGQLKTSLSTGHYTLSWVLQFDQNVEEGSGWHNHPVTFSATDGNVSKLESLYFPLDKETASREANDGWLEYDALHFNVGEETCYGAQTTHEVDLTFSLTETESNLYKRGLSIDGVVIRPTKMFSKAEIL